VVAVLAKPILCNSIAPNGSDFTISGSYPVSIASAAASACNGGTTREVVVTFTSALQQAGNFTITLNKGSDGNTLIDECGEETLPGSAVSFAVKDTVNPRFTYSIGYGCVKDTVRYFHAGSNGVNSWNWNLSEGQSSTVQNPTAFYSVFNEKPASLVVSNGFCSDSSTQTIKLLNFLKADFTTFDDNCPNEPVIFTSTAQGIITSHRWTFGDGGTATVASPTHIYTTPMRQTAYTIKYTVVDSFGCESSVQKKTSIYTSCYLAVPSAFTPNGDGLNDIFYPLNAIKAEQLNFVVFNRWGQKIYSTTNWKQGWNGTQNSLPQPTGTYVWVLSYTDRDTKKRVEQKGTVVLIR
jgi:gliding motility-associated-like protein